MLYPELAASPVHSHANPVNRLPGSPDGRVHAPPKCLSYGSMPCRVALTVPGGDSSASAPDLAQPLGVLVPQRFSDIPAIDITFDDKEATKARLEFQHLGEHQFDSQQQQLARTYHNFLIHRYDWGGLGI